MGNSVYVYGRWNESIIFRNRSLYGNSPVILIWQCLEFKII